MPQESIVKYAIVLKALQKTDFVAVRSVTPLTLRPGWCDLATFSGCTRRHCHHTLPDPLFFTIFIFSAPPCHNCPPPPSKSLMAHILKTHAATKWGQAIRRVHPSLLAQVNCRIFLHANRLMIAANSSFQLVLKYAKNECRIMDMAANIL